MADELSVGREFKPITEALSTQERFVLSQLVWNMARKLDASDEAICRVLEAQGLINKIANGRWAPTAIGRFRAARGS